MGEVKPSRTRRPNHERIILHFDYDCFYASVFEQENPALKSLPLAVQQKQIIVTCNYEARRRGLRKLQLISEAKQLVPDVVIVLGEELGRFRDASKALYKFLENFTWSRKVERLGFDEVFMDVSDIISANIALLNPNNLENSFFQLRPDDPTVGFPFNATSIAGHTFPKLDSSSPTSSIVNPSDDSEELLMRLILGSHLAQHLRWSLEEQNGYTSTVGISTNKLLSKLVGNLNKPKGQTTLIPPYTEHGNNVTAFIDSHEIGKIPGIGCNISQKIRNHVLSRPAAFETGLIYGGTLECVTAGDVRTFPDIGPDVLEGILSGPGSHRGVGGKIWGFLNGIDDTEVQQVKKVPSQISLEDSYMRLDTMTQVIKELRMLSVSLIKRMHVDLLEDDEHPESYSGRRWIAYPKTVRLSTRPRPPLNPDGTRTRSFNRISRSGTLPNFIFNLKDGIDSIVEKLVQEVLLPLFRKLHPQQSGWNLSLVNICVTNMVEAASEDGKSGNGRDIGQMFKKQDDVLRIWKVEDRDVPPDFDLMAQAGTTSGEGGVYSAEPSAGVKAENTTTTVGSEDVITLTQTSLDEVALWDDEDADDELMEQCHECGAVMPGFAMAAHERFHSLE